MKEKDVVLKRLESFNDVFADIVNVLMFGGKHVVRNNALSDAMPYSYYKSGKAPARKIPRESSAKDAELSKDRDACTTGGARLSDGLTQIHGQERDAYKYWNQGRIHLCLIGLENQTAVDPLMPLRVMSYDAAGYMQQFLEKDRIRCYPVTTLVLYFGTRHRWSRNLSLKEVFTVPPEYDPFVSDYRINVAELAWLSEEQIRAFRSDFREIVAYLRCRRTGEPFVGSRRSLRHAFETLDLMRVMSGDEETFRSVGHELAKMIGTKKTGGVNMCEVIQKIKDEGRIQGAATATNNITALLAKLHETGRNDDLYRALSDRDYLNKLMAEYTR